MDDRRIARCDRHPVAHGRKRGRRCRLVAKAPRDDRTADPFGGRDLVAIPVLARDAGGRQTAISVIRKR